MGKCTCVVSVCIILCNSKNNKLVTRNHLKKTNDKEPGGGLLAISIDQPFVPELPTSNRFCLEP
jgi:hypothetical protein